MPQIENNFRRVLSGEETGIKGLALFGHGVGNRAELPMLPHQHRDKAEFVLLVKGVMPYMASGIRHSLYQGDVFFTPPNEVHASLHGENSSREERPEDILWFQLDLSVDGLLDLPTREAEYLRGRLLIFDARRVQAPAALQNNLLRSFMLLCDENIAKKIKGRALFVYSLLELISQSSQGKTISEDISAAKQFIAEHITEQIDMDELTRISGLSLSELRQKFLEQLSLSPRDYINRAKVEASIKYVTKTNRSFTDIAFGFSFSTTAHFSLLFKQVTGFSPRKYRKKAQRGKISEDELL